MRFFYFLLYTTLNYALRIFYKRIKTVNSPKEFLGRTIYVSNHAASFMDPLVVASLRLPIVFFMTRSDVFTTLSKPFLRSAHMLPIYREHDGGDTKNLNQKVFQKCTQILSFGRNLLIFGEGFTDDVFIRRLKPVKKGAARIGFMTLESMNWKKKVYMAAVGCNYSDPNKMRSDLLISTSKKICLNDYQELYLENPNKAIHDVTKEIEHLMQEQITHVKDKHWSGFHENVMRLTRKGMNAENTSSTIPVIKKWHYSQKLAHWLNDRSEEELEALTPLKTEMEVYFSLLRKLRLKENYVYEIAKHHKLSRVNDLLLMMLLLPFALLGALHCAIPYVLIKRMVEKSFKRRVFWGSVKLLLGMIIIGLINIPVIFLFHHYVFPSYWLGFAYYMCIGLFGLAGYIWWKNFIQFREKGIVRKQDLTKILSKRKDLLDKIHQQVPVA